MNKDQVSHFIENCIGCQNFQYPTSVEITWELFKTKMQFLSIFGKEITY